MGKKRKKVWRVAPLCLFWIVWHERNRVAFDNEAFSTYRLKSSFICNFWSWSNVCRGDRDRSLLDFLTWMGVFDVNSHFKIKNPDFNAGLKNMTKLVHLETRWHNDGL